TIVLPGPWSKADLRFQSEHIATQKLHNAGFNCVASQVLVLPAEWSQSAHLMDQLRNVMEQLDPRHPYYPGADRRQSRAVMAHPQAEVLDDTTRASRTLIRNIDPRDADAFAFKEEFFAGVLAQTSLPGKDAAEYLENAVSFCNERLHGTLGANLIIHPRTIKELGPRLENALAKLRYGSIGVNIWQGAGYLLAQTSWGAYPGHEHKDIQSGIGVVHNAMLFDKPEKSVVYGPFRPFPRAWLHGEWHTFPKPPWFLTHRFAHEVAERLVRMEGDPSIRHLPGIFWYALRG
ncbi:MAG: aldehyde dehydrogenase, partial [Gammaproteobacteria bacterium]|nr:aldehyde dehydrogenase [Gammaproteobacteria bacterium]